MEEWKLEIIFDWRRHGGNCDGTYIYIITKPKQILRRAPLFDWCNGCFVNHHDWIPGTPILTLFCRYYACTKQFLGAAPTQDKLPGVILNGILRRYHIHECVPRKRCRNRENWCGQYVVLVLCKLIPRKMPETNCSSRRSPRWTRGSRRMLLVLIHEFESSRDEIMNYFLVKSSCWPW